MAVAIAEDEVLKTLESWTYVGSWTGNVKEKLLNCVNLFNSHVRPGLMHPNQAEIEELSYLLSTLKKSIAAGIADIGKVQKKLYHFSCSQCNERINIDYSKDFWCSLQDHQHIEDMYYKCLNGIDLPAFPTIQNEVDEFSDEIDQQNENVDSGIENTGNDNFDNDYSEEGPLYNESRLEDVNSFRFNFKLCYDDVVESKLYPKNLLICLRRFSKSNYSTIQRTGTVRAVCLLCCRELMSRTKVTRTLLQEHVIGQRHINLAKEESNIAMLNMYHETWLGIEMPHQCHQVFFIPAIPCSLRCVLCGDYIICCYQDIKAHIEKIVHKEKVLRLQVSSMEHLFSLLDVAVQAYGEPKKVQSQPVEKNSTKQNNKLSKNNTPKTSSDSNQPVHNIIKAIEGDKKASNCLELIPNRFRKSFDVKAKSIYCRICQCSVNGIEELKKHIELRSHIYSSKSPLLRYKYYCEICNEKLPDELQWQKHFNEGPNQHQNMAESRKARVTEYECTVCSTVIFGDELSLSRHRVTRGRRVNNKLQLPDKILNLLSSVDVIESGSKQMTEEANESLHNNELVMECCKRLEVALDSAFNKCKAYPFGSRVSGLGHKDSDLDVFIDIGGMYTGKQKQDTSSQVQIVRKAAAVFQKNRDEFSDVVTIATARTPIVRVIHEPTSIDCDLSFRHGLSVENTKFLKFCMDMQSITQPFVLMLKKWSEINNMKEYMSNYAMTIMAIFYLQVNGYLLSVKEIRDLNPSPSLVINGWETLSYTVSLDEMKRHVKHYPFTLVTLLTDFFEYYSKFNYMEDVVCPLLGHVIKKNLFKGPRKELLPEMETYVLQLDGEDPEEFRCHSVFCVQDPFDLSHNLTKAWQSGTLIKFKQLCELTCKHLEVLK